jgi:hypothetical protein
MGLIKEIEYFNCFLAKKVVDDGLAGPGKATWPSFRWNPTGYPKFPLEASINPTYVLFDWYVEEARIRGGYNNTIVDLGVRAFLTESEDTELTLSNGIIYSGLYNSKTGVNKTNVFSVGENITKELDPRYGAIQKLYTTDTNLIIFQENKVSNALIDKDAIYSADGNPTLTASQLVLGQINQYAGEYGISNNPESFAFKGYRIYFSDKNRGAILRLSRDGITEISSYGMRDYFRDTLSSISERPQSFKVSLTLNIQQPAGFNNYLYFTDSSVNTVENLELGMQALSGSLFPEGLYVVNVGNGPLPNTKIVTFNDIVQSYNPGADISFYKNVKDKVVGAYDNFYDKYVVSMQQTDLETYDTASFNDSNNGWTSLWDYDPSFGGTLNNIYYTTKGGSVWKHYDESVINNRGTFYGTYYPTSVTLSFNPMVSVSKNFNTVNYEGTNGWQADFFLSDPTGNLQGNNYKDESSFVYSYDEGSYTESGVTYRVGFNIKDNKYFANLVNKGVQANGNNTIAFGMPGQVVPGASMSGIKGFFATVKLSTDDTTDLGGAKNLFAVSSNFVKS